MEFIKAIIQCKICVAREYDSGEFNMKIMDYVHQLYESHAYLTYDVFDIILCVLNEKRMNLNTTIK